MPVKANQEKECVSANDAYQSIKKATVLVASLDEETEQPYFGTGLVVDNKGTVVTSAHVISDRTDIIVLDVNGVGFSYKSIPFDDDKSVIALVPESDFPKSYIPLKRNSVEITEKLFMVSHPQGIYFSFSEGFVSAKYPDAIIASIPASQGSSGGAVFDCELKTVGFVYGINTKSNQFVILNPVEDAIRETDKIK